MQAYEHQSAMCVLITKLVHSAMHFTLILLTQEHAFLLQPKQTIKLTHFILINLKILMLENYIHVTLPTF